MITLTSTVGNSAEPRGIPVVTEPPARAQAMPCADCGAREACLPGALPPAQWGLVNQAVCVRQRVRREHALYRAGEDFSALYALRGGSFKSYVVGEDGRDQMTAIHLRGEVLGTEGIAAGRHTSTLVALEDSEVCVIAFGVLRKLSAEHARVQKWFHRILSGQIVNNAAMIALLGTGRAEERLAAFLLNLSRRFAARGYSPREFSLNVTRHDIGSHLGLSTETVSRAFSRFQREGLVRVWKQRVQLVDTAGLERSAGGLA
jgi:CRP/FNR family transcriptional regulator